MSLRHIQDTMDIIKQVVNVSKKRMRYNNSFKKHWLTCYTCFKVFKRFYLCCIKTKNVCRYRRQKAVMDAITLHEIIARRQLFLPYKTFLMRSYATSGYNIVRV